MPKSRLRVLAGERPTWSFHRRSAMRWTTFCWAWKVPVRTKIVAVLMRTAC